MTNTRQRLHRHVRANPGVHFNRIKRDLDIATGQVQYHVTRLCRTEQLESEDVRGRTHYFDSGAFDAWERRAISLCRRETVRDILAVLLEDGALPASRLTERITIARSTLAFHVSALVDAGLLTKAYDERGRAVLSIASPETTEDLLAAVSPAFADRLVDRFSRPVDANRDPPAG